MSLTLHSISQHCPPRAGGPHSAGEPSPPWVELLLNQGDVSAAGQCLEGAEALQPRSEVLTTLFQSPLLLSGHRKWPRPCPSQDVPWAGQPGPVEGTLWAGRYFENSLLWFLTLYLGKCRFLLPRQLQPISLGSAWASSLLRAGLGFGVWGRRDLPGDWSLGEGKGVLVPQNQLPGGFS